MSMIDIDSLTLGIAKALDAGASRDRIVIKMSTSSLEALHKALHNLALQAVPSVSTFYGCSVFIDEECPPGVYYITESDDG